MIGEYWVSQLVGMDKAEQHTNEPFTSKPFLFPQIFILSLLGEN